MPLTVEDLASLVTATPNTPSISRDGLAWWKRARCLKVEVKLLTRRNSAAYMNGQRETGNSPPR